jgi:hypothetical protein
MFIGQRQEKVLARAQGSNTAQKNGKISFAENIDRSRRQNRDVLRLIKGKLERSAVQLSAVFDLLKKIIRPFAGQAFRKGMKTKATLLMKRTGTCPHVNFPGCAA